MLDDHADIKVVQLLKVGKFKFFDGADLEITSEILLNMKKNFKNNVKKVDLAVDFFHHSNNEAAGWINSVILKENNTELWIGVDWTEEAEQKIRDKKIRYLSADFDADYEDNETGKRFGHTLNGAGLTNRPFVKGMDAILDDLNSVDIDPEKRDAINRILNKTPKEVKTMEFSELKKEVFSLSEDQKKELVKICGGETQVIKLSDENSKLTEKVNSQGKEILKLSTELTNQAKETEFATLLSEGKAVAAQKPSFLSGNMTEFLKLAQPVNLDEKGNGGTPPVKEGSAKTFEEAENQIIKLAEKKREGNKELSEDDSFQEVMSENPDLAKLYNA